MKNYLFIIIQVIIAVVGILLFTFIPVSIWIRIPIFLIIALAPVVFINSSYIRQLEQNKNKIKELKKVIKKFNHEVHVSSSQVLSVSENLNITLDENNGFAQQLYAETKEMAALNSEVNENIHETINEVMKIVSLLEEGSNTSDELEKISTLSNEVIKSSLGEILKIVETINSIQESTNGTMENMNKLNNTSKEIVHILETVYSISKQTQLLALNATIESARAGEAGKGFGVVAEEIGKLATETNGAVSDINKLIKNIQMEIQGVFDVVRENSERVSEGVLVSSNIGNNLGKIDNSFSDVMQMVKRINELSQSEAALTKNVGTKIEIVEKTVAETSNRVEEVTESVHRQKHSIQDIADMGSRLNDASKSLSSLFSDLEPEAAPEFEKAAIEEAKKSFNIISKEFTANTGALTMDKSNHKNLILDLLNRNGFIEAAWTNDKKGRFICSIPEAGIANASVREWFKRSIEGESYMSPVYISAITRNPCITLSVPIKAANGEILGVFGIDIKLKN